jgi:hypothetical protein
MPKCIFVGCDQTAFYGPLYNQPRFCKAHAEGSGSVKKKCAFGYCGNAAITDFCSRCGAVQAAIHTFKESRLGELVESIKKENENRIRTELSAPAPAVVKKPTTLAPSTTAIRDAPSVPPKLKAPKIVRTPDEPKPVATSKESKTSGRVSDASPSSHASDPAGSVIMKRAQTPGRARGVPESKN